jgi:hypothetical protein
MPFDDIASYSTQSIFFPWSYKIKGNPAIGHRLRRVVRPLRLTYSTGESRPRLRGLGSPEEVPGVGGLGAVSWGFQELMMGCQSDKCFPCLVFSRLLRVSMRFLMMLLQMTDRSKILYKHEKKLIHDACYYITSYSVYCERETCS